MSGFHLHFISTSASSAVTAQLGTRLSYCCYNRRWMPVPSREPAGRASSQPSSNRMGPSRSTALHSTCKSRVLCNPSQEEDAGPRGAAVLSRASSGYQPPPDAARAHLHRAPGCSSKLFPAARRRELYLNTSLSRQARCSGGDGR